MTDKVMRPIRKEEYSYWDYNTDSEYETRKNSLDKKLTNIQKEKEMYDKAINLINSLKNI